METPARWQSLAIRAGQSWLHRGLPATRGAVASWDLLRTRVGTGLWRFHPSADFFLARGGDLVPPPLSCNVALTNACNLRCEICGSQKFLDETGVRRRHMDFEKFEAVAATIFPFLVTVELNSQGDPLLYPRIEDVLRRIAEHRCELKVQTNGTLFTDRVVDLLVRQHGTVMISLDAVGAKLDDVRRGASWANAEPGIARLLAARDPRQLAVGLYPTLTKRTIGEALRVVEWAAANDVDQVSFHRYAPIKNSFEAAPSEAEYAALCETLLAWAARNPGGLELWFESEALNRRTARRRRSLVAHPGKQAFLRGRDYPDFPLDRRDGDPVFLCMAPQRYVEIGLDGEVGACCRAQDVPLGFATSAERFADVWLGPNYARLRRSLRRDATGPYPLPNCEGCVRFFAPRAARGRTAIEYGPAPSPLAEAFDLASGDEIPIEQIQRERGHCLLCQIPPGVDPAAFALFEDDRPLGPAESLHDAIRDEGAGRYSIWGRWLYFSTSDNSDARRNERRYRLRRRSPSVGAAVGATP